MKIFFIAAGDSIHSKKWIAYFAGRGHRVFWFSLAPFSAGDIPGVESFYAPGNILSRYLAVKKAISRFEPEIVHAHYAGYNGLFGALSGFHPFVLTAWGSDVLVNRRSFLKKSALKLILKCADIITCDAQHLKNAMIDLGASAQKIEIVRFGIDTEKFKPGKPSEEIKKKLDIAGPAVISLRSLESIYDLETLVKAVPAVVREIPKAIFIIAGKGSQEKMLKSWAGRLRVAQNIKFIGAVPNDELPAYLRVAAAYVSTSLSDAGIASSTAEAMACGLPAVVTDSGENRNWVKDGKNGFVVPVRDPDRLAQKIVYLLSRGEEAARMGKNNIGIIKEKNDYWRQMEDMEAIYAAAAKNDKI